MPEIFGYTGTRNPKAMDMAVIILATASSIEYLVWCVGGEARSTNSGTPADLGDELEDLAGHQQPAVAGLGPLAVLDLDRRRVALHLGMAWMISSHPK